MCVGQTGDATLWLSQKTRAKDGRLEPTAITDCYQTAGLERHVEVLVHVCVGTCMCVHAFG